MFGFCVGGMILMLVLVVLKECGEDIVLLLILLMMLFDFFDIGEIGLFIDEKGLVVCEVVIGNGGLLLVWDL